MNLNAIAKSFLEQGVPIGQIVKKVSEKTGIPRRTVLSHLARKYIRKKHTWTKEDIEQVKALSKELAYEEIGQKFGVSGESVKQKMYKTGFKKPMNAAYVPKDEVEKVLALFRNGLSIPQIARKTGRTYDSVHCILRLRGFKELNRERDDGKTGESLAKAFLVNNGWQILNEGRKTPYDFLISKNGKIYAVNVKSGKNFVEPFKNFKRLLTVKHPIALLYVTPENPPAFFLLPITKMEV